jgi:hypothetical protein
MSETVKKVMDLVHDWQGEKAIQLIREKPLRERANILLASNVIWHFVRYDLAENAISLIKEQELQVQKKILCIAFVVSDFTRLGWGSAIIDLIQAQPERAQKDILGAVRAEDELRDFGFGEKIEEIKAGWKAFQKAVRSDPKPSTRSGRIAPSF